MALNMNSLVPKLNSVASRYAFSPDNSDLLFGGTSPEEYRFLTDVVQNSRGPNFAAFLAGVQGYNLAQQQARQRQGEQALRTLDQLSTDRSRYAQANNTDAQTRTEEINQLTLDARNRAALESVQANTADTAAQTRLRQIDALTRGDLNQATVDNLLTRTGLTGAQTQTALANAQRIRLENSFFPDSEQARIDLINAQARGAGASASATEMANLRYNEITDADIAAREAQAVANRASALRTNVSAATDAAALPYAGQQARANVERTEALNAQTAAQTGQIDIQTQAAEAVLPYAAAQARLKMREAQANINFRDQATLAQFQQNITYLERTAAEQDYLEAQTEAIEQGGTRTGSGRGAPLPGNLGVPGFGAPQTSGQAPAPAGRINTQAAPAGQPTVAIAPAARELSALAASGRITEADLNNGVQIIESLRTPGITPYGGSVTEAVKALEAILAKGEVPVQ